MARNLNGDVLFSAIACQPVLNGDLHAQQMALWFGIRMESDSRQTIIEVNSMISAG